MNRLLHVSFLAAAMATAPCVSAADQVPPPASTPPDSLHARNVALIDRAEQDQKLARERNDAAHEKNMTMLARTASDLDRQEHDMARFEKILDTWERQQAQYQKYLDSLPISKERR